MMTKYVALMLLASSLLAVGCAGAVEFERYSETRLHELQAEGRSVLVDVHADWCPTCKRQGLVLAVLLAEDAFADYAALMLDWDGQRSQAQSLGAPRQSTLFVFRNGKRLGMSVAETDEAALREFLSLGIAQP